MVFGAEINCYPTYYRSVHDTVQGSHLSPNSPSAHRYVNSGGFIGTKSAIERFFAFYTPEEADRICDCSGGDQELYMNYYIRAHAHHNLALDRNCNIFWNMHLVKWSDLEIVNGRIHNIALDSWPCMIHFNGGTFQTQDHTDILPIIVDRMEATKDQKGEHANLNDYQQIVTDTCVPCSQVWGTQL